MLDVHPPHEPVHGWRDFLLHILTITIGLLIALTLEAAVEAIHHRHIVAEARENIRLELRQNHEAIEKNIGSVDQESNSVKAALDTMRFMRTHPHAKGSIDFHWDIESLHDAAWLSARDTGALGYMPYKEVQGYADLYASQESVSQRMANHITREIELLAPILIAPDEDFSKIPEQQFDDMVRDTGVTLLDLQTLKQLMRGLDASYIEMLKQS